MKCLIQAKTQQHKLLSFLSDIYFTVALCIVGLSISSTAA